MGCCFCSRLLLLCCFFINNLNKRKIWALSGHGGDRSVAPAFVLVEGGVGAGVRLGEGPNLGPLEEELHVLPVALPQGASFLSRASARVGGRWVGHLDTWSLHDPDKNEVITRNNGVIDPFLKGHGDSGYILLSHCQIDTPCGRRTCTEACWCSAGN